eukprot:363069-Chlamydomonas_euryale.AAC.6
MATSYEPASCSAGCDVRVRGLWDRPSLMRLSAMLLSAAPRLQGFSLELQRPHCGLQCDVTSGLFPCPCRIHTHTKSMCPRDTPLHSFVTDCRLRDVLLLS